MVYYLSHFLFYRDFCSLYLDAYHSSGVVYSQVGFDSSVIEVSSSEFQRFWGFLTGMTQFNKSAPAYYSEDDSPSEGVEGEGEEEDVENDKENETPA